MAFRKGMKRVKRGVRKVTKFAKKVNRHPVTKGIANIAKIAQMVKLLNVEKKRVDFNYAGSFLSLGQYNTALATGALATAMTPTISQGITGSTRNGNSIKLVSCCLDLFVSQQANTINAMKLRWFFVCLPDNSTDTGAIAVRDRLLEPNPFVNIIDYHSSRDPEFFTQLKIIKQGQITLAADQLATGIAFAQRKIPLKLNHHMRYNSDASTLTTKNKFFLIMTADTGDANAASYTGANVGFNIRYYYVDN